MRNIVFGAVGWALSIALVAGCAPRSGRTSEAVGQARQASLRPVPAEAIEPEAAEEVAGAARMPAEPSADCPVKQECAHPVCEAGKRLDPGCDPCVQAVCDADATCCAESWDGACVQAAGWLCGACGVEGCGDLPTGGACLGDLAVRCEGGAVVLQDCAGEGGLTCGWLDRSEEVACL